MNQASLQTPSDKENFLQTADEQFFKFYVGKRLLACDGRNNKFENGGFNLKENSLLRSALHEFHIELTRHVYDKYELYLNKALYSEEGLKQKNMDCNEASVECCFKWVERLQLINYGMGKNPFAAEQPLEILRPDEAMKMVEASVSATTKGFCETLRLCKGRMEYVPGIPQAHADNTFAESLKPKADQMPFTDRYANLRLGRHGTIHRNETEPRCTLSQINISALWTSSAKKRSDGVNAPQI